MKKRIVALLIVSAMIIMMIPFSFSASAAWDGGVAGAYSGGSGTEADPYLIGSATELALLAKEVNDDINDHSGHYFKLTADIDLGGITWIPIGCYDAGKQTFRGNFDGDGHTVSGVHVQTEEKYAGLFGRCVGSCVKNLTVEGDLVSGLQYSGGVMSYGIDGASVVNCVSRVTLVTGFVCGGIVGRMQKAAATALETVEKCTVTACVNYSNIETIAGKSIFAGGIVGAMGNGIVNYCANFGNVNCPVSDDTTTMIFAGGIMGVQGAENVSSHIFNCINHGSVTAIGDITACYAGGIVGRAAHINDLVTFSLIKNCISIGKPVVKDKSGAVIDGKYGSIAGHARYIAEISNCYTTIPLSECEEIGIDEVSSLNAGNVTILTADQAKGEGAVATMKLDEIWVDVAGDYPTFDIQKAIGAEAPDIVPEEEETTVAQPEDTTTAPKEEETTTAPTPDTTTAPADVETTTVAPVADETTTAQTPSDNTSSGGGVNIFVILIVVVALVAAGLIVVVVVSEKKKAKK